MWKLLAELGAAAIFLGGAYVVCKELEEENESREKELSRKREEYTKELNAKREELEKVSSMNEKTALLQQKHQLFLAYQQKSKEAYQVYLDSIEHINFLKKQFESAFSAKEEAKKELNILKEGTLLDKAKRRLGFASSVENSPQFQEKLQQVRDYSNFCQKILKDIESQKQLLQVYHSNLKKINHLTHDINLERKKIRDENLTSLVCCDCNKTFYLTVGEVLFFQEKKFDLPKRCFECRAIKKGLNTARQV